MSYYDVDAILTDAEKVPCIFELDVPYLGHLDNSTHGLKASTPLSLPLWLAEMLALTTSTSSTNSPPLTLQFPTSLSPSVLSALKADPRAVALRDQNAHFFAMATRFLELFEEADMAEVLRRTFALRATDIGLHARKAEESGLGGWGEEFLRGLEEWERGLFRRGHEGVRGMKEWMEAVKK